MSEYTTSSTAFEVVPTNHELLASLLSQELGAPSTWVSSGELQLARQSLATVVDVRQLNRLLESAAMTLPTITASATSAARSSVAQRGALPVQLRRALEGGLAAAEGHVLQVERRGSATLAIRALERTGYQVRFAENGSITAVEARRGHSVLLVGVSAGGAMQMDWAGHAANGCTVEMDRVQEAFAAEGLHITVRRRDAHGSAGGGSLITRAARAGHGDLVAGLLVDDSAFGASSESVKVAARARLVHEG